MHVANLTPGGKSNEGTKRAALRATVQLLGGGTSARSNKFVPSSVDDAQSKFGGGKWSNEIRGLAFDEDARNEAGRALQTAFSDASSVAKAGIDSYQEQGFIGLLTNGITGAADALMSTAPEALTCTLMKSTDITTPEDMFNPMKWVKNAAVCAAKSLGNGYLDRLSSSTAPANTEQAIVGREDAKTSMSNIPPVTKDTLAKPPISAHTNPSKPPEVGPAQQLKKTIKKSRYLHAHKHPWGPPKRASASEFMARKTHKFATRP